MSSNAPSRQILVTSALPYANGSIHLGHMLEYIQTDMWVRFQKLRGNQAIYVCADDAHGSAIMLRAEKEGITPEQLIANVQAEHTADFADFGVEFDNYHSTHSEENRELSAAHLGQVPLIKRSARNMPFSGSKYWVTERVAICPASRSFR